MNKDNNLKKKVDLYFDYFSNKKIEPLISLFSDNILLRDWEIEESGKSDVKKAFENIFNNTEKIKVNSLNNSLIGSRVYCEIDIIINEKELLKVVDIIDFNKDGLIYSIKAFKG